IRGNARIHVAHVTTREGLDSLPAGASCEASPLHLFLDISWTLGARGKVNPPLRSPGDREALWDAFRNGRIDAVASDHAPHTLEEKEAAFAEAPAGAPGVATSFPLLMRRSRAGDLERFLGGVVVFARGLLLPVKPRVELVDSRPVRVCIPPERDADHLQEPVHAFAHREGAFADAAPARLAREDHQAVRDHIEEVHVVI